MTSISLIGVGRMGSAISLALSRAGCRIGQLIYRSTRPPTQFTRLFDPAPDVVRLEQLGSVGPGILIIAVGDESIAAVARTLAPSITPGTICLHLSGALSSAELAPLAEVGGECGSMHPLVSVSDGVQGAANFTGAFFCIEGSAKAVEAAQKVTEMLGGRSFSIASELKPLYHAGAVLSSGHMTALFATACETLEACGLSNGDAHEVLLPLLQTAVSNLDRKPAEKALTGPLARGDAAAVDRHIQAFGQAGLETPARIYLELGLAALRLAENNGLGRDRAAPIEESIKLALRRA